LRDLLLQTRRTRSVLSKCHNLIDLPADSGDVFAFVRRGLRMGLNRLFAGEPAGAIVDDRARFTAPGCGTGDFLDWE
jgi:hypothetical protein